MAKNKLTVKQGVFEFDIVKKFETMNASAEELRTGLWMPVERLSEKGLTYQKFKENGYYAIETSWGEVRVKDMVLTQLHRDILDCALAVKKNTVEVEGGGIAIYFQRTDVLKKYGKASTTNLEWLDKKFEEIQKAKIEMKGNKKGYYRFGILDLVAYSETEGMFGIRFSAEYRKYIESRLTVGYENQLEKLLSVENPLLKAIIRFFWTHDTAGGPSRVEINKLLSMVGYPTDSPQMVRRVKREIEANIEMLSEFGIYTDKDKITNGKRVKIQIVLYRKPEDSDLTFCPPISPKKTISL